jgi:type IV pilus assembly protein PilO
MALTIDSIIKLPTSRKVMILVGILCAIAGLYFYFFLNPKQEKLKDLNAKFVKLDADLKNYIAVTKDLEKFRAEEKSLNQKLSEALKQLPNEKEIPEILKNITSLGKESNLEFTLFKPKPEEPQQFYAKVPIELIALGNYHNVGIFFDKVGKLPRIINVVDFNMTRAKSANPKGKGEIENLLKTSCLVNTYRFLEKKVEEKPSGKKTGGKAIQSGEEEGISKPQRR